MKFQLNFLLLVNLITFMFSDYAYEIISPIISYEKTASINIYTIIGINILTIIFLAIIKVCIFNKFQENKYFKKYNTTEKLKKMHWEEYEKLVKVIFESNGYTVSRIGGHGADGGIDLIVKKNFKTSMVQCKRYSSNVGVKVVREMFAVGIDKKMSNVYIYTSADFTKEAYKFAKNKNVILMNGDKTLSQMKKIK